MTVLGAAALTLWGAAGLGHGATHGEAVRLLHAAHAGAMALWVVGVTGLVRRPDAVAAARFSPWALGCVLTLAVTGSVLMLSHAGSPLTLLESAYGRALALKLALFAAALGAVLAVRRALHRQGRVRLALGAEAALLLGVLAVTAALSGLEPPPHSGHGAPPESLGAPAQGPGRT